MQHSDTSDTRGGGNTVAPPPNTRARAWFFTWNNHTEKDFESMETWLKAETEKYQIQEETGENGTPHIQGCFLFKNARYFSAIKKKWDKIHIEKCKNFKDAANYCSKEETRTGKSTGNVIRKIRDPLAGKTLRPIQEQIINICDKEPDDRTIHWVFDRQGGAGKTTLAKHLCLKYPNEVIYLTGKSADMKYGITSFFEDNTVLRVVLIDLTRSVENFVSYEGLESIKNGIFYNTKYESKMVIFDNPHVIVLANFMPETDKLSLDRWDIINVESTNGTSPNTTVTPSESHNCEDYDEDPANL